MDIEKIIAEVLRRIEAKMSEVENKVETDLNRPAVLVISQLYHQGCKPLSRIDFLNRSYKIDYAIDSKFTLLPKDYDIIVAVDLDDTNLSKLSMGIFDNPYLETVHKALLEGKEIIMASNSLEFMANKDKESSLFYRFFEEKLDILKKWGIRFKTEDEIINYLKAKINITHDKGQISGKRQLVTEAVVREAMGKSENKIAISQKALVTDLARELAANNGITIVRMED